MYESSCVQHAPKKILVVASAHCRCPWYVRPACGPARGTGPLADLLTVMRIAPPPLPHPPAWLLRPRAHPQPHPHTRQAAGFWRSAVPDLQAQPPGVPLYCFYSYGLPSAARMTFRTANFSDLPAVEFGNGDVTVPYASLALCRSWGRRQAAPVRAFSYYGLVHATLTSSADALEDIVDAVAGGGRYAH